MVEIRYTYNYDNYLKIYLNTPCPYKKGYTVGTVKCALCDFYINTNFYLQIVRCRKDEEENGK